jgi:hypothetical protein
MPPCIVYEHTNLLEVIDSTVDHRLDDLCVGDITANRNSAGVVLLAQISSRSSGSLLIDIGDDDWRSLM